MAARIPQQERARRKVEQILAAAHKLLVRDGPEGVTTNHIAAEAQVSIGTLYEYFPNKRAIADALMERFAGQEAAAVFARLGEVGTADLWVTINTIVDMAVRLRIENRPLYSALLAFGGHTGMGKDERPGEHTMIDALTDLLAAQPARTAVEDPALAAYFLFHTVDALAMRVSIDRAADDPARLSAEIATIVGRYLGVAPR